MGLLNFFRNKKLDEKKPYYGDLKKTQLLSELFETVQDERNEIWRAKFLDNVAEASFACGEPQIIDGPDGFPYFQLNIPEANQKFECFVIKHLIEDFILKEGVGIVINATKNEPDWVFAYGDLVNYHFKKVFYSEKKEVQLPKNETIKKEEEIIVGQPSETILPINSRILIRNYLINSGVSEPKVLLMTRQYQGEIVQELVFNLNPDLYEKKVVYEDILNSISWYLPKDINYCSMNENSLIHHFKPL